MSTKYSGGLITKNPVTPAGPYETGAAPGVWTVEQALQYTKQGIWPTQGNVPNYIEDVFSTYLYRGNDGTQTITNGVDLAGKGGLVWIKERTSTSSHIWTDTARGIYNYISSNSTNAQTNSTDTLTAFNSNGFTISYSAELNEPNQNYASWTFRKQPKFFDVVTYTGTQGVGGSGQAISHNLGSEPGCIIIKPINDSGTNWTVYHRGLSSPFTQQLLLNSTAAVATNSDKVKAVSSTTFTAGWELAFDTVQYVAYVFAHNAGGFGLTGTDNVISCGSFTTDGSGAASVTLGYEPQWVLIKYNSTDSWRIFDNMRGMSQTNWAELYPNTSDAEVNRTNQTNLFVRPNATGFTTTWSPQAGNTAIYIAIRRGPMKVPTSGTSVFSPVAQTNTGSRPFPVTAGFPVDSAWFGQRSGWGVNFITSDRLRGATNLLITTITGSESANNSTYGPSVSKLDSNTQFFDGMTNASEPDIYWMFKRAPGYFDEVCYTGTGTAGQTYTHNLGVAPEFMIVKNRTTAAQWLIYQSSLGNTQYLLFTGAASASGSFAWNNTSPTSSVFSVGTSGACNTAGENYVAYLFATLAGVSKVGSYTGTGTLTTINCGFTGGARFVLIKRTSTSGSWFVWDTARGMVSGTDPALTLNTTNAEFNSDSVYSIATGFQLLASPAEAINTNGDTYIFLAIA